MNKHTYAITNFINGIVTFLNISMYSPNFGIFCINCHFKPGYEYTKGSNFILMSFYNNITVKRTTMKTNKTERDNKENRKTIREVCEVFSPIMITLCTLATNKNYVKDD